MRCTEKNIKILSEQNAKWHFNCAYVCEWCLERKKKFEIFMLEPNMANMATLPRCIEVYRFSSLFYSQFLLILTGKRTPRK